MGKELRFDGKQVAGFVFSGISTTGQKFGVNYITLLLIGSKSQKILKNQHQELDIYGSLKEYSFEQVRFWVNELIDQGYLIKTGDEYPVVHLTEKTPLAQAEDQEVLLTEPDPNLASKWTAPKGESINKTLELFKQGKTILEIVQERNLAQGTILSHLAAAYEQGEEINIDQFVEAKKQEEIVSAFKKLGTDYLTPVKKTLAPNYTWEDLKLVRAKLIREQASV